MTQPTLDYQPPDKAELKRLSHRVSPASVIAGGCVGLFLAPIAWGYIAGFAELRSPQPRLIVDLLVAAGVIVGAIYGGRQMERSMPDARGIAMGLTVSTTLVTLLCSGIRFLVR